MSALVKGMVFGRLTVVKEAEPYRDGHRRFRCRCKCGTEKVVGQSLLKQGQTRSCGCLRRETACAHAKGLEKHGHAVGETPESPTYATWRSMRDRCRRPSNASYPYYGARGITVCARWDDFENFLADMGERPEGRTLDRIDPEASYEPSNCRWATNKEQRHNRRTP